MTVFPDGPSAGRLPSSRRGWVDRALTTLLAVTAMALLVVVAGAMAGFRFLTIQSGSMTPTLRTGDLVLSRSQLVTTIRAGEIITFEHPALHVLVTHRVEQATRHGDTVEVITKGDANLVSETWHVAPAARVDRTVLRIPGAAPQTRMWIIRLGSVGSILALGGYLGCWLLRRIWRADPADPADPG